MNQDTLIDRYYRLSLWITRLAYLNLLWILFSAAGLFFLSFFPATTSMFGIIRKWMRGEEDFKITKTFWCFFRTDLYKANLVGYLLLVVGYLLVMQLRILWMQNGSMYVIAGFGIIAILSLFLVLLLFVFPVYSHFDLKVLDYLKFSMVIGIVHPILTVVLGIGIILLNYFLFYTLPAILLLFGGSLTASLLSWGAGKTFGRYEDSNSAGINSYF